MDTTILTLGVDSSQVGTAAAALDRMASAGAKAQSSATGAESGIRRVGKAAEEASSGLGKSAANAKSFDASLERIAAGSHRAETASQAFVAALRDEVATFGKSREAILRYQAAQVGASEASASLILQLENIRAARDDSAEMAQREAASQRFLASLRDEVATLNLSRSALIEYRAAQLGVAQSAAPLVKALQANADAAEGARALALAQREATAAEQAATTNKNNFVASLRAEIAMLDKSADALLRMKAAQVGAGQEAGPLITQLTNMRAASDARRAEAAATALQAQSQQQFITSLQSQADAIGKSRSELLALQAAKLGVSNKAAPLIALLAAEEKGLNKVGLNARQAAFQHQQLAFQLNDFAVQVVSGGNPLIALVQQGSQLSGTYGGIGNAVKAVTGLLTPFRLVVGGAATAVGALGYAFHRSQQQSYDFAKAVLLSGNASGQTEGKVNALAAAVSRQSASSQSDVREMAQALIASGRIGSEAFDQATRAAVLYQQVTGKTADEVAKSFAEMARSPTQAAASLGEISDAQYRAIKAAEDGGDATKAQALLYEALAAKLDELTGKMPFWAERTKFLGKQFDEVGEALKGAFSPSIEQQIGKVQSRIDALRNGSAINWRTLFGLDTSGAIGEAQSKLNKLMGQQKAEKDKADAEERDRKGKDARAAVDSDLDRVKPQRVLDRKTAEKKRQFSALAAVGTPVSAADQAAILDQLKKSIMPAAKAVTGGGSSGLSAASQTLRSALERDINSIQQVFERERDAIEFQNRFLQGEYQAGTISLKSFYDQRRANTEQAVNARIAALDKEAAREAEYLKAVKDPSEKKQTQTRIDDIDAEKARLRAQAAQDVELANQEETASFKALNEQIVNYRASLLEMAGDEKGAAELRANLAIDNAKVLAGQSGGQITAADVQAQARRLDIQIKFNEVQKQTAELSGNAARAEEAFALSAEQRGLSLVETERGVYAIRAKELEQLGELTRQAQALAAASTDPRIKQFAADLTLQYQKAANAIDPALTRLREVTKELAAGLASTVADLPNTFARAFNQRRLDSRDDIKAQKAEYDKRIDNLRGYLAQERDVKEKAKLRNEIKDLEGKRDGVKGESKGKSFLNAINESLLKPAGEQVFAAFSKVLIQDPLQRFFETQLKGMTEGGGFLAGFFKDAMGIKEDPKLIAEQQQTASISASTQALDLLTRAAQSAANAVVRTPGATGAAPALPNGEAAPVSDELVGATEEATGATADFGQNALSAASDLTRMAGAAGLGGDAMQRLPGIIGLFQSAVAAMAASGSGSGGSGIGGLIGAIAGAFAGGEANQYSGAAGYEAAVADTGWYHAGGIVGGSKDKRSVASGVFASATRYHKGGIAGLKSDEVPAVLMGGPKGKREEVLTADDPRHRDNLGMNALARIMKESKHEGLRVRGARELGGPVSANSMYRVNEKRPELLEVAGKQYLMTGAQGGKVTDPGPSGPQGGVTNINVTVAPPQGATRTTAQQFGAAAAREMQRSLSRN